MNKVDYIKKLIEETIEEYGFKSFEEMNLVERYHIRQYAFNKYKKTKMVHQREADAVVYHPVDGEVVG